MELFFKLTSQDHIHTSKKEKHISAEVLKVLYNILQKQKIFKMTVVARQLREESRELKTPATTRRHKQLTYGRTICLSRRLIARSLLYFPSNNNRRRERGRSTSRYTSLPATVRERLARFKFKQYVLAMNVNHRDPSIHKYISACGFGRESFPELEATTAVVTIRLSPHLPLPRTIR